MEGPGVAALTFEEYRDTGFFMRFFRSNQDDEIFMKYQMPHRWDPSGDVRPHMHCIAMGAGSGVAVFSYKYAWAAPGGEFPANSGWTSGRVSVPISAGDVHKHKIVSFGAISPPAGAGASSILILKVSRPGQSDPADTYEAHKATGTSSANIGILFFDMHYQSNRAGTAAEY